MEQTLFFTVLLLFLINVYECERAAYAALRGQKRAADFLVAASTGSCELPDEDAGSWTQVLQNSILAFNY